jgi:hypothetical protein
MEPVPAVHNIARLLSIAALTMGTLFSEGITRAAATTNAVPINRHALVTRHKITWNEPTKHLPLGNGEFSFGADGTGLQTFAGNSMSHWGWHSFPLPDGWTPDRVPATGTFQKGRNTGPDNIYPPGTDAIRSWMSVNTHIMNLGRMSLMSSGGSVLTPREITGLERSLDTANFSASKKLNLWSVGRTVRKMGKTTRAPLSSALCEF